jgi:NAD(P)-dependent dehydrogenase (short-subunit alcohol dehydrogenase family)
VYNLNVRSPPFATITAAKAMIVQGTGGCVLNIASVDGLAPAPTEALYASAKAAVLSLTSTSAYEFGTYGIWVNAIAPCVIETEMTAPWLATDEARVERASFYPINRIGQPEDIVSAALYLCSDDASWVSGVTLPRGDARPGAVRARRTDDARRSRSNGRPRAVQSAARCGF